MKRLLFLLITISYLSFIEEIGCQTVAKPVEVSIHNSGVDVSAGEKNYVTIQLKVPKGIWLGADKGGARTPPATKIITPVMEGFTFESPQYPASIKEWVPAKLGTTKVFKEKIKIIVPFKIDATVTDGSYDLLFKVTYTPGYDAGRIATHYNELYQTTIIVNNNSGPVVVPSPSMSSVSNDFYIKPKRFENIPDYMMFMFNPLNENSSLTKGLHKFWLDKKGHGKSVRMMPFPIFSTSKIVGTSTGMGLSFANATKEGTMTGMFSMAAYYNNLIGSAFSLQAISCPGAYHNYQLTAIFGGEGYRNVRLHYENFTLGNSSFGIDLNIASTNEPRMRFYGTGSESQEEDQTAYEQTSLKGIVDLYSLPIQNLRLGVGIAYSDRSTGQSFAKLRETDGIPFLQETSMIEGLLGLEGAKQLSYRANVIFDHRDQEFAPSKGFYTKMTASRNSLYDITNEIADAYYGLDIDMRMYFQVHRKS